MIHICVYCFRPFLDIDGSVYISKSLFKRIYFVCLLHSVISTLYSTVHCSVLSRSNTCYTCYSLLRSLRQCILCMLFALVFHEVYISFACLYMYVCILHSYVNAKTSIAHILVTITPSQIQQESKNAAKNKF